jgi:hypothetical protein
MPPQRCSSRGDAERTVTVGVVSVLATDRPPCRIAWRDVAHGAGAAQGVSLRVMETHAFKDPVDPTKGGIWSGDYGIRICTWAWNSSTKVLEVRCGSRGKSSDLSGIDLSMVDLRDRLPEIALQMADLIAQGK